jgi:ABC-type nitrate/sulfonate/bicarbonate transport system permease component
MEDRGVTPSLRLAVLQILAAASVVALWALANATGFAESILPPVTSVAREFVGVLSRPEFLSAFGATVFDAARGLLIAAILAIPLGILIGMLPSLEVATRVLIDFGRSFPVIALLPILVLLLGATAAMKVVAIAIACFFPILLQTIYGARRLDPTIADTVRSYRIPAHLRFFRVLLPAAGPFIATGLRIATTVSILVAVGVEIVSLTPGLGREISLSRSYNETATTYAYIVYAGLLGVAITMLWDLAEARLLRWHIRAKAE